MQLHYTVYGSGGNTLVLLHGNRGSSATFAAQIPYFVARGLQVIAVDTRGHGASPRGSAPFTIATFVADLYALLTALGVQRPFLMGFSDGGNIALQYAIAHPGTLGGLVVCGANLNPAGLRPLMLLPVAVGYGACAVLGAVWPTARRAGEYLSLLVCQPHISLSSLVRVRLPALVVCARDDVVRRSHTRKIAAALRAKLAVLPGGHNLPQNSATALNRCVWAFLRPLM